MVHFNFFFFFFFFSFLERLILYKRVHQVAALCTTGRPTVLIDETFFLSQVRPKFFAERLINIILFLYLGFEDLDQILRILLCTNMMVGGLCAFLLDNILPNDDSIIKSDNEDKNIQSTIFEKKGIFRNLKDRISKAQGSNYAFFNIKSDSQEPGIELGCSESQLFATQLRHDARSNWHNYKTFAESFRKQEIEQTGEEEDANVYELPYFWGYLNRQWWVDYMPFLPDRKTEN